ncbi:type IV pilus modification PilV family protein [Brevifollis gellanilyticus]|uniref:type IV pilus modification PilV family protein n=1 Tax=Brevifollis gellanilyticus TaxID=748831 RepID=UPI0011BFC18D|nr:prepilin-type N-terminal cleavage/methylation domain-containing protein [Brevifollis gellanilyticus]
MKTSPPKQHTSAARRTKHSRRCQQGFSLVECILSIAITATSLLGIIGMLAGSLSMAKDSKEVTISGVLIRQLAGELRDLPRPAEPGAQAQPLVVLLDESMRILKHSSVPADNVLAMYDSGTSLPSATYFARVDRVVDPNDPLMDSVVIRVESPASGPAGGRTVRRYASLIPK